MKFSIGILTHRSPFTLASTLSSYKASGLYSLTDDITCIIQPSDKAKNELDICREFGIRGIIESENGMMAWGIKRVFEEAKYSNVLFWRLIFVV